MVRTTPPARRADDARLARLVRDLERRRRLAEADARPEQAPAPQRARLASTRCCVEVTHDPAMLLWLSGTENTKGSPNENYARELMELFTLGAGRGYTERDVREQARALTGWTSDWKRGAGPRQLPLRPRAPRRRHASGLRQAAATSTGTTPSASASTTRSTPSFFVDKLWSYFIPVAPDARDAARARGALPRATSRSARSSRRSSGIPRSTPGRAW